eukprot:3504370-Prymnesium_polylepis.1
MAYSMPPRPSQRGQLKRPQQRIHARCGAGRGHRAGAGYWWRRLSGRRETADAAGSCRLSRAGIIKYMSPLSAKPGGLFHASVANRTHRTRTSKAVQRATPGEACRYHTTLENTRHYWPPCRVRVWWWLRLLTRRPAGGIGRACGEGAVAGAIVGVRRRVHSDPPEPFTVQILSLILTHMER